MRVLLIFIFLSSVCFTEQPELNNFSKCLTGNFKVKNEQGRAIKSLARPVLEKNIISKNNKFRIHFDTSKLSGNLPALVDTSGEKIPNTYQFFIDSVEKILNEVIAVELNSFEFSFPPGDDKLGGGNELDIYILDLGNRTFGYTEWDEDTPIDTSRQNKKYTTYIVVDNDYGKGFRTKGIDALKTTLAHEFFHTIQIGNFGLWNNSLHYYEMSAESIEPFVFPNLSDYLFDLKDYFQNHSSISLMNSDNRFLGYERAIWNIFLHGKFGYKITKQIWNEILNLSPQYAQEKVLKNNYSTTTAKEFISFTTENYKLSKTLKSDYYFNASKFPKLTIDENLNISQTSILNFGAKNFTSRYIHIQNGTDSNAIVVVNLNETDMQLNYSNVYLATIKFFSSMTGTFILSNSTSYDFIVDNRSNWFHTTLKNVLYVESKATPFPNPVDPNKNSLMIPVPPNTLAQAKLVILSSELNSIYSSDVEIVKYLGNSYLVWKCVDNQGRKVATGVYYYYITNDEFTKDGKFVVLNK